MNAPPNDDPRSTPGFQPELFPQCDGEFLSVDLRGNRESQKLKLAAAFYHLNVACQNLAQFRQEFGKRADSKLERTLLQKIESALLDKEAKEDELARIGMCVTPTIQQELVVDLAFCEPTPQGQTAATGLQSASMHVVFDIGLSWDSGTNAP